MVSGAPVITLTFGPLSADRDILSETWDVLLGIVSDFSVRVGERTLVYEQMFPVVELAASLKAWLNDVERGVVREFAFESLESADGVLLSFSPQDEGWKLRSTLQEYEERGIFSVIEVRAAASRFIDDLRRQAAAELGLRLDDYFERR